MSCFLSKRSLIIFFIITTIFTGCASHSEVVETTDFVMIEDITNSETKVSIPDIETSESTTISETEYIKVVEYDTLQSLFVSFTPDTTVEELESFVTEHFLSFTSQEYNKLSGEKTLKYIIAYTDGVAKQKYADSGDYIDIIFDKDNDLNLMYAQYCNLKAFGPSALFYCYGTWYDFRDANASDYSGYYLVDSLSREDGITIEYTNENKVTTPQSVNRTVGFQPFLTLSYNSCPVIMTSLIH